jgi:hypothetical protein
MKRTFVGLPYFFRGFMYFRQKQETEVETVSEKKKTADYQTRAVRQTRIVSCVPERARGEEEVWGA